MAFPIAGQLPNYSPTPANTTFAVDASTDYIAFGFVPRTNAPIVAAEVWVTTKTGTPHDLQCVLVANSAGLPGAGATPTDVGGGSPTLVALAHASITTASRLTITFTNAFTPTPGTRYWLVLYPGGTGGSAYSASHRYIFNHVFSSISGVGAGAGDERSAMSTDTGTTWATTAGIPWVSFLTTGSVYITTTCACCFDAVTVVDVDDTTNPDERGTAFDVPANTTATIHSVLFRNRSENATSDFAVACYDNDTQLESRAIDQSEYESTYGASLNGTVTFLVSQDVAAGHVGRVAIKSTDSDDFMRHNIMEFGSQARRESTIMFGGSWYCNRNAGGGSFTDDKTRWYMILPVVSFAGSGAGGGMLVHPGMGGRCV